MATVSTPSCSILVVSSDVESSEELVNRLITLASPDNATVQTKTTSSGTKTGHIPWMISNQYYTAPVYFLLKGTHEVLTGTESPAFIFVFDPTVEDYQIIFTGLLPFLKDSDFEVSLAVSMGDGEPTEEQQEVYDSFFSSSGFEYINGQSLNHKSASQYDARTLDGVPGLGRIIDSLSTILWPSMTRKARHTKTRSVIHMPNEEEGLRSLLSADSNRPRSSNRTQEMAALEKWLEAIAVDDDDGDGDGDGDDALAQEIQTHLSSSNDFRPSSEPSCFDDNFSDFVSAPRSSIPTDDGEHQLPSRHEIEETTRRIMELEKRDNPDDDNDANHYDLSHVLAGLEVMKSEIAGIQDEHERRRAAAKVALSLAYGFENDNTDYDV